MNRSTVGDVGRGIDRREFLARSAGVAALVAGGVAVPSLLAGCSSGGDTPAKQRALALHHDVSVGPLFEPFVADFNKRYRDDLTTSYPPQDYFGTTQTQLAAGDVDYDVLFTPEGYAQKWYEAGWIRALDDLPGVQDVLADIPSGVQSELRGNDGKLIALPYLRAIEVFCYNSAHLAQVGRQPPQTWDEFVSTCRLLKSRGVSKTPYSPFWLSEPPDSMWYQFNAEMLSDGSGDIFGPKFEPLFAKDPAAVRTLERWQLLYREGLVPADLFTTAYGDMVNVFGGGRSTFTTRYAPQLVAWRDPKQSKVAGVAKNGLLPGATHETLSWGGVWTMTSATVSPDKSWELLKYLAWKDSAGQYYVPKNLIAIKLGLQTPYDKVNKDPEVTRSWSKWADLKTLNQQLEKSRTRGPAVNQTWYLELVDKFRVMAQDVVRGKRAPAAGLNEVGAFVESRL